MVRPPPDNWTRALQAVTSLLGTNCVQVHVHVEGRLIAFRYQLGLLEDRFSPAENAIAYIQLVDLAYTRGGEYESVIPPVFGSDYLWVAVIST